ncbi:MAG: trypsin-like serine protease [Clostridiales bacterium]|nr:trypsin-like serine protease [Clostridiales bacterium]
MLAKIKKDIKPALVIAIIFMLVVIIGNIATWTIITNKLNEKLEDAPKEQELVLDEETRNEIADKTTDKLTGIVKDKVEENLNAKIAKDYYLPKDYTNPGLYVGSLNLYNVIELTCYGRQKTSINDDSTQYNISSKATATIITDDGYAITNAHVVTFENYKYQAGNFGPFRQYNTTSFIDIFSKIVGKFAGQETEYTFTVIACDTTKDLALIKLNETVPKVWKKATLANSSNLKMGEDVIAMGNAQGYGINMTFGIVSKPTFYDETYTEELVQTDAAINPGNSGGALYNVKGEIIGINSAKIVGNGVEGMGFAIASNGVKKFIDTVSKEMDLTVSYDYRAD